MRIVVAAIGRLKRGPETELAERYRKRAEQTGRGSVCARSKSSKSVRAAPTSAGKRMLEESIALANRHSGQCRHQCCSTRAAKNLDSAHFATQLGQWRADNRPAVVFMIGGADGLAASLRDKAKLRLAFGAATWPHQMVRVMLLEQIYRAVTILSGHPYHRG